jgi:cation transport ATPase
VRLCGPDETSRAEHTSTFVISVQDGARFESWKYLFVQLKVNARQKVAVCGLFDRAPLQIIIIVVGEAASVSLLTHSKSKTARSATAQSLIQFATLFTAPFTLWNFSSHRGAGTGAMSMLCFVAAGGADIYMFLFASEMYVVYRHIYSDSAGILCLICAVEQTHDLKFATSPLSP